MNSHAPKIRASIQPLEESAINRIAAGEVVERPASAVKELVENAIDAGATRIEVSFVGSGADELKVMDNGMGMDAEDLELCIEPHHAIVFDELTCHQT